MPWGQFPEVTQLHERRFVRGYWRYLLGWGPFPDRGTITANIRQWLTSLARQEVRAYRKSAKNGATIYAIQTPSNKTPPPPKAA